MFALPSVILLAALFLQPARFEKQILATDLAGGYQVVACDVNGDGKLDLIALASDLPDLVWFENPTWQRRVLATNLPHMINAACWSPQRGQPPRIAVAYEFSMHPRQSAGTVAILEPPADTRQPWHATIIDHLPASHRLRWADIDGSGQKVLVNAPLAAPDTDTPDYRGHVPLVYYRPGKWERRVIGDAEEGIMHGIFVTPWDPDGRDALLIGSFLGIHLYRLGSSSGKNDTWSRTALAAGSSLPWPKSGTSDITAGYLDRERFLAAIEPWHGNEVVVYREKQGAWSREVIDDTLLDAHTIGAAAFDRDSKMQIVVGFRGKPYGIYLYRWNGAQWARQILEQGGVAAAGCAVADLDGDGAADIACIGSATHNLAIYWNR